MEKLKVNNKDEITLLIKVILFVSLFSSSFIFFKQPFEFYFHYIIFIILIPIFFFKYGVPKFVIHLFFIPLIIGLIHLGIGNNDPFNFIKIFFGLIASILFFYYLIEHMNFNISKIFNLYIKFSYYLSLIGLIQVFFYFIGFVPGYDFSWIFNKWGVIEGGILGIRINSILAEPSQLAIVLSPAIYVSIRNLIHKENFIINKYQSIIILLVCLFTTSSIGLIGIILALLFNTDSYRIRYLVFGVIISIISYNVAYNYIPDFKSRVDAAVGLWIYEDFNLNNTNNSSFVLYNNIHIAKENIKDYPIFGTGLGSYENAFNNHTLTGKVIQYDFEFNTKDGNSLLIRICVEIGLLGVLFFILFMYKGLILHVENKDQIIFKIISQSIFILIVLSMIRQGNYMLNGLPLLFLIYYYNFQQFSLTKQNI